MDACGKFGGERAIDLTLPGNAVLPLECARDNLHPKMRLATRPRARVSSMSCTLVFDLEEGRVKCRCQLLPDRIFDLGGHNRFGELLRRAVKHFVFLSFTRPGP